MRQVPWKRSERSFDSALEARCYRACESKPSLTLVYAPTDMVRQLDKSPLIGIQPNHQALGRTGLALLPLALRLALLAIALVLTTSVALGSKYGAHPDERFNIDAFEFFETHWWPPDVGSDEVIYTSYGASRVYRGELVYVLYGKLGGIARAITRPEGEDAYYRFTYWTYRLFNVALLGGTLAILLFNRCWRKGSALLALAMVCLPQVLYLYAYANSDAWGLSLGLLLLALVFPLGDKPLEKWPWVDVALLGLLTGLLLAAKQPFLLSLGLPYALLGWHLLRHLRQRRLPSWRWIVCRASLVCLLALAIAAPLRVIYPLTQGNFQAAQELAREKWAHEGFKPSNPTAGTLALALLTMGPLPWERAPLRALRLVILVALFALAVYTLTQVLLPSDLFW